jgi:hypothetical protein
MHDDVGILVGGTVTSQRRDNIRPSLKTFEFYVTTGAKRKVGDVRSGALGNHEPSRHNNHGSLA